MTDQQKARNILELDRVSKASPEVMFAIWTEPRFVSTWFASSHGFEVVACDIDLRPGGVWRVTTTRRGATDHPWGVYHDVRPAERLTYSYRYEGTDFHSTVSVDFVPSQTGTLVQLKQTGFPDADAFFQHGLGWRFVLDLLEQALLAPVAIIDPKTHKAITKEVQLTGIERDLKAALERAEAEGKLVQKR